MTCHLKEHREEGNSWFINRIENWFDDEEVISQVNNASCHKAKEIEAFLQERHIKKSMTLWNYPDLNPIDNL